MNNSRRINKNRACEFPRTRLKHDHRFVGIDRVHNPFTNSPD